MHQKVALSPQKSGFGAILKILNVKPYHVILYFQDIYKRVRLAQLIPEPLLQTLGYFSLVHDIHKTLYKIIGLLGMVWQYV